VCGTDGGQLVGLDAATGVRLWRFDAGSLVRGIESVAEDIVVVATDDGRVMGLQIP
jgi:outer membrane protein assembly factor BamB